MFSSSKKLYLFSTIMALIVTSLTVVTPLAYAERVEGQIVNVAVAGAPTTGQSTDQNSQSSQNSNGSTAEAQNFDANGSINAITFITKFLSYDLQGVWSMHVRDGNIVQFEANMAAVPSAKQLGKSHTHQLLNYQPAQIGIRDSNNNFFTNGTIDIGTNEKVTWQSVPVVISIIDGASIIISIDDQLAGHHFAGQPIIGTVDSIINCSQTPGASMSIESVCQDNEQGVGTGGQEQNDNSNGAAASDNTSNNNNSNNSNNNNSNGNSGGQQFTVTLDSDTYGQNEIPQITGTIESGAVSGTVAQVDVSDSSGKVVYNTVAGVSADGSFFTTLKNFSPGQYNVVVTYHGNTGSASFQVVKSGGT